MTTFEDTRTNRRTVVVDEFRFAIDALDSLGLAQGHAFEPDILLALKRWVQPGATVVDIGANIGYFTAHMARLVGSAGTVHAFEPEPDNFELLIDNMHANGLLWVQAHQAAVGAQAGTAVLHTSDYNGGMHRLYDSVCCTGPAFAVPVLRLDQALADTRIDLIKIDIEGYEPAALLGAQTCLQSNAGLKIISEYCPASILEAGGKPGAFLSWLHAQGFSPHRLDGHIINIAELIQDAQRYETYGSERFVADCKGQNNPEILNTVVRLSAQLGCTRPVIENLLFMR